MTSIEGAGVESVGSSELVDRDVYETDHFRIICAAGSFASRNLPGVGTRLEGVWLALDVLLHLDTDTQTIDVFLDVAAPADAGDGVPDGVASGRSQIRDLFSTDSPGRSLERLTVALLLRRSMGVDHDLHPFILDGLSRLAMRATGAIEGEDHGTPRVAQRSADNALPALTDLIAGDTRSDEDYEAIAESFVDFLIQARGAARFQMFARTLAAGQLDRAARAAYGVGGSTLERAWRREVAHGRASSMGQLLRFLGSTLRPYPLKTAEIFLYSAMTVAFGIGFARTQGIIIDRALIPGDTRVLGLIMVALGAAFALVMVGWVRLTYVSAWVAEGVVRDLRSRMFAHILSLDSGFFARSRTGDLVSRVSSDVGTIEYALAQGGPQAIGMFLMLLAAVATVFLTNWKLAIVAVVGTPLFYALNRYLGPRLGRASLQRQESLGQVVNDLQEALAAEPVVKAFGLQATLKERFAQRLGSSYRASVQVEVLSSIYGLSATTVTYAIQLAVLGVGGWLVIGHSLTLGSLVTYLALLTLIIGPVQGLTAITQTFREAAGSAARIQEVLATRPAVSDRRDARPFPEDWGVLRLENVTFGYAAGSPVLRSANLSIPAGSSVVIVGPSGSGKSTLVQLLLRYYDPQRGRISIDGLDLRNVTLDALRGQIGVVFQETVLFDLSIRENIRLGMPSASDDEVEIAARAAELHDYIMTLPDAYDTAVGERGARLSGGQRQRVAIARAVIRNPAILMLDEATSALDPRTEAAINDTIIRLSRGRTTISVTHRLASAVNAQRIFVLDRGEVAEEGTHDDLVEKGGLYADLWKGQGGYRVGSGTQYVGVEAARLRQVPLFAHLDADLLDRVADEVYVERFRAGEVIVREGDAGDRLYIIQQGRVDVLKGVGSGGERRLAGLGEGDHFGEVALLRDVPRGATVRAVTPVQLYSITRDEFEALVSLVPRLDTYLREVMEERDRSTAADAS